MLLRAAQKRPRMREFALKEVCPSPERWWFVSIARAKFRKVAKSSDFSRFAIDRCAAWQSRALCGFDRTQKQSPPGRGGNKGGRRTKQFEANENRVGGSKMRFWRRSQVQICTNEAKKIRPSRDCSVSWISALMLAWLPGEGRGVFPATAELSRRTPCPAGTGRMRDIGSPGQ